MMFDSSRVLSRDSPRATYHASKSKYFSSELSLEDVAIKGLHFGQRKLLLSEIEFLTSLFRSKCVPSDPNGQQDILIVYAGAANGSHLPFLFSLFPTVKYVLIDPAPFCAAVEAIAAKDGPILELINSYCTDELCMRLKRQYASYDRYLISDIRSGAPSKMTNRQHTEMILRDNEWQRSWCWSLQCSASMLKFHPPYPKVTDKNSRHFDENDDTADEIEYLDGQCVLGVWAPKSSSEVRLVVDGPFLPTTAAVLRPYNCKEFEEQCYHYNTHDRYAKDVAAERQILGNYISCSAIPGKRSDVAASPMMFSSHVSKALGYELFTPLEPDFGESDARLVALLYFSRQLNEDTRLKLFQRWRTVFSREFLWQKLSEHLNSLQGGGEEPDHAALPENFWRTIGTSRGLEEAYSFPPFYTARTQDTEGAPQHRGDRGRGRGGRGGRGRGGNAENYSGGKRARDEQGDPQSS